MGAGGRRGCRLGKRWAGACSVSLRAALHHPRLLFSAAADLRGRDLPREGRTLSSAGRIASRARPCARSARAATVRRADSVVWTRLAHNGTMRCGGHPGMPTRRRGEGARATRDGDSEHPAAADARSVAARRHQLLPPQHHPDAFSTEASTAACGRPAPPPRTHAGGEGLRPAARLPGGTGSGRPLVLLLNSSEHNSTHPSVRTPLSEHQ